MTVPVGRDVSVIVSDAALTVKARTLETDLNVPSCSSKTWFVVPLVPAEGEPLIFPVVASSVRPVGSGGVTSQV